MKKTIFTLLLAALALYAKPVVTTTILPTKFFVQQIAGDTLEVDALVEAGADPHTYEPKPSQMKNVEKSDLHFAVGLEFDEIWLPKLQKQFPNLVVINTQDGITKIPMAAHHHHDEEHADHDHEADHEHHEHADHDGEHEHHEHHEHEGHHHHEGMLDPHVWLDPQLVKIQVQNITNALVKKYPENKALYEQNSAKFISKLDEFDKSTKDKLKDIKNRKFMVYHPSWGYFAKRYDLVQIPVEIEGKEPKPADLKELIHEAKEEKISVIFVAPQFSKKAAKTVAKESGAVVVEINQLPENWLAEMQKTVDVFAKYLK
ncbi:metal ABC transporter solute-binding protein, Zn/Mn family [Campylobacter geochelonis]|uniref:metal ABC transporter solute-binding protein, Zn/Mn family n=1 Tax=Campylobacter geochelonis TaxID=1780362 RepID=UPI0007708D6B|nr:zinc ABC transporter substrate-binding protein [Campylobacter geochelonis]CZE46447.1 periplasmic solute binding protein [Campylobacter geochelonis]